MSRPGPAAHVAIVVLCAVGMVLPSGAQTFRARAEIVTVDVLVKSGKMPVPGLTAPDFELTDNGVVQQIDVLRAEAVPIDLTLVLDVSASTRTLLDGFKKDIQRIARLLGPNDRVRLIAFAGNIAEVFGFRAGTSDLPFDRLGGFAGASAVNDALLLSLAWLPDAGRRHLIAAFTDGQDNASLTDRAGLTAVATRAPAVLHVVVPPVRSIRRDKVILLPPPAGERLRPAAEATGGSIIVSEDASKILDGFKIVFETFRSGYVLQYTPRGVNAEGWHELAVRMKATGTFEVHARKGYAGG